MPTLLDLSCPACDRIFDTEVSRNRHLRQSKKCSWYRSGKLAEWSDPIEVLADLERVQDINLDSRNLFELVPPPDFVSPSAQATAIGEAGPGPSTQAHRISQIRALDDDGDQDLIEEYLGAGARVRLDGKLHDLWRQQFGDRAQEIEGVSGECTENDALYYPFTSRLDWQIAHWVIKEDIGHNALNRLLAIPEVHQRLNLSFKNFHSLEKSLEQIPPRAGKWYTRGLKFPDAPDELYLLRMRDPVEAIRSLWGDPTLARHLVYRPRKVFANSTKTNRLYSEMWSGTWWHAAQSRLPLGATLAPLILATDKTHLTNFSSGKQAYPVYLTLGNLPKAIRRQPSMHACVLIGYLPTEKVLSEELSVDDARARQQRVFHEAMRVLLEPLVKAGTDGVEMTSGDGEVRLVYPVLAAYVADFPEQCLVACSKGGTCPKCRCPADQLQDAPTFEARTEQWTTNIMEEAKAHAPYVTSSQYRKYCMDHDVSGGAWTPFWESLPHSDIHLAITPDVLHQLYQGVFKHLVSWCQTLLSETELDRRIHTLPPAFGVRHFQNGISALSQITGSERKHMAKVLLACLVGLLPNAGLIACRGILDFIYYAQYPSHNDDSLAEMQNALDRWETNKQFFIRTKVRDNLNIPKFHALHHYIDSIRLFGTTDNYNTELFERLHIDFAKHGYRASNKRDAFPQMVRWLERQEKVVAFDRYLEAIQPRQTLLPLKPSSRPIGTRISIAKHADTTTRISTIEQAHTAPGFSLRLRQFLNTFIPGSSTRRAPPTQLPFDHLGVFHQFTVLTPNLSDDEEPQEQTVKCVPSIKSNPARFDTVVVLDRDEAEAAGLQGTRIGRVKVVFKLPQTLDLYGPHPAPAVWPKGPLAYVEWYSPMRSSPAGPHGFYQVARMPEATRDHVVPGAIVPLSNVRQVCMLTPCFGDRPEIDSQKEWTSDNVLDHCNTFFINNWQSMYSYRTIW